jgi:hypothetical protein
MTLKHVVIVITLVILSVIFRTEALTASLTDWHSFRQADTASVTREYTKHGIDLLHPKFHDYSNIASGKDNPEGYRMVEFPFVNALTAWLTVTLKLSDVVVISRLVSIGFSLITLLSLYALANSWFGGRVATWTGLAWAIVPYIVFYSRVVLPEPSFVAMLTSGITFFWFWLKKDNWLYYIASGITLALALLLKPFGLFLLPLFAVMIWWKWQWKSIFHIELYALAAVVVGPLVWWRNWIKNYPEGIPASDWLFNSDNIRLRPAWFRWLGYERFLKLISGWFGAPLVVLGVLPRFKNIQIGDVALIAWWVGLVSYMIIIATGNVRHDYYQVMLTPAIALSMGRGLEIVLQSIKKMSSNPKLSLGLQLAVLALLVLAIKWGGDKYVKGYYGTRSDWETAGHAADVFLPTDAKVIAPAFGDTAFLFQTKRTGWPIGFEIEDKIEKGAQYYVTTSDDDEARGLRSCFTLVAKTTKYEILDLTKPTTNACEYFLKHDGG